MSNTITLSIDAAIEFLRIQQLPYGEFKTCAALDEAMQESCHFDSSLFVTAQVVYSISHLQDARVQEMKRKALGFFREQMEVPGLWRYWSSRNTVHPSLPIDLDDTSCISYVLKVSGEPAPANAGVMLANRSPEGLFYTWLAPRPGRPAPDDEHAHYGLNPESLLFLIFAGPKQFDQIDSVVNANVVLYLGENEGTASAIAYLTNLIVSQRGSHESLFYPHAVSLYYAVSRAYVHGAPALGETIPEIERRLTASQRDDGSFGNPLLTGLAANTLLNFGVNTQCLEACVGYLLTCQATDGSWRRAAMYVEPGSYYGTMEESQGPGIFYGSEELTTALCVEALAKYVSLRAEGSGDAWSS